MIPIIRYCRDNAIVYYEILELTPRRTTPCNFNRVTDIRCFYRGTMTSPWKIHVDDDREILISARKLALENYITFIYDLILFYFDIYFVF